MTCLILNVNGKIYQVEWVWSRIGNWVQALFNKACHLNQKLKFCEKFTFSGSGSGVFYEKASCWRYVPSPYYDLLQENRPLSFSVSTVWSSFMDD